MTDARARVALLDQFDGTVEQEVLDGIAHVTVVDPGISREEQIAACRDADAILLGLAPVDEAFIGNLDRCRIIARFGIGVDNVDREAARERGIVVTNVPDFCVEEVATHALALALSLVRRIPEGSRQVADGGWGFLGLGPVRRVSSLRFGVVGLGRIGTRTAELARAVGFEVVASTSRPDAAEFPVVEMEEVLATSDVVSLHVPLTDATTALIDRAALSRMKRGAVLINTARGGLLDLVAVVEALESGALSGAGLDVLPTEPPLPGSLPDHPQLLVTPHSAFCSVEGMQQMRTTAARQVALVLTGLAPENVV